MGYTTVRFEYHRGRPRIVTRHDADLLERLGRGTYSRRDMRAEERDTGWLDEAASITESDYLDDLDADALRAMAERLGLEPHHRAGAKRLREMIREHHQGCA